VSVINYEIRRRIIIN